MHFFTILTMTIPLNSNNQGVSIREPLPRGRRRRGWHIWLAVAVLALGPVRSQDQRSDKSGDGRQAGKATGVLPQFSAWLRKHGVDDGAVRLVEEDGSGWGNGIVARRPLKEGDLLFRIPLKWCLHSVAAKRNAYLAKPISHGALPRGMTGEAIMVALLLMVEACQTGERSATCALRGKGPSDWLPYIRALPSNFSAPVFWSTAEFGELKGSQLEEMVASDLTETRQEWTLIQTLIGPYSDILCDECFNFDTYRWAAWNVHSRALTLRGVKYLIPLADMVNYHPLPDDGAHKLNHQDLFLKYHRITVDQRDEGTGTAEIFADRDFEKGSLIVESYGDNPNNMYLRYFGFVPESNPTDCRILHFSLQQVKDARDAAGRAAMLKDAGLPAQVRHCFRLGEAVPAHVLKFLRVLHARKHELGPSKTASVELSVRNEKAVYKTLAAQCDKLLADFPTVLDEDERWLEELRAQGESATRLNKKNAVMARVSEKRILKRLRKNAKRKIKQLKERESHAEAGGGAGEQILSPFSSDEL